MYTLVEIGILNAITATVLAGVVLLVARVLKRPAVIHALWVLVLLKFVTPPLIEIPVGLRVEHLAALTERDVVTDRGRVIGRNSPSSEFGRSSIVVSQDVSELTQLIDNDQIATAATTITSPDRSLSTKVSTAMRQWSVAAIPFLLGAWAVGTVVWFAIQAWRIVSFQRLAATSHLAGDEIQRQTEQLAQSIGARRAPKIWVLNATISPILWAVGSRARVIFPADLLDRVDADARATLLMHELSHFHRGDHWVRLLEFFVTGLFWWHPAIWIARRGIEVAEEHCCDAWVVEQFPGQPRRYAEALLDTIDFLSEHQPRLAPVASGLGQAPFLRQRIRLIMSGVAPKAMSAKTRLGVLVAAAVMLPLGPQLFEGALRHADAALASTASLGDDNPFAAPNLQSTASSRDIPSTADVARETTASVSPVESAITANNVVDPQGATKKDVAWAVVHSPDGRFHALAKTNGKFFLRDAFQGQSFDLSKYQITSIAFAPHRDLLAAGSLDSNVYLFDCASGEPVATFSGHTAAIGSLAVSLDSRFVVSGSRNGGVKLWDIDYQREVPHRIPTQSSSINCVRFSSDGRLVAVASGDWKTSNGGSVALWDLRGSTMKRRIDASAPIGAIAFGVDQLVTAQWNGQTTIWNLETGASALAVTVDKDTVSAAAFAADAQSTLFDAANGTEVSAVTQVWFQRMDHDQDGRLAWNEFQGPRGTFRKLDIDADEMVSWDEATRLQ